MKLRRTTKRQRRTELLFDGEGEVNQLIDGEVFIRMSTEKHNYSVILDESELYRLILQLPARRTRDRLEDDGTWARWLRLTRKALGVER